MSFGFSVGDFITIIEHTNRLRKSFAGAPSQFKDLSNELRNLQIVVHDVEVDLSTTGLGNQQKSELSKISKSCCDVLADIESMIDKYSAATRESNRMGRMWRRITWQPDEVRDLRIRVSSSISILNAFNGNIVRSYVSDFLKIKMNEQDQMCLEWLSPTSYATQQSDYRSRRQPGTGQWFLESSMFHDWVKMPHQTLFCPGIPGAGKTILASAIIDQLDSLYRDSLDVGVAYLYCDFHSRHDSTKKLERLLGSLVRQLLQKKSTIPADVVRLYHNHRSKGTWPSSGETSKVLRSVVDDIPRVFIIVDALDEYNDSSRLLDEIFGLQMTRRVSFLATSRFIPEIMARFQKMPMYEIQASQADVMSYLSASLKKSPSYLSRKPELHEEIIIGITNAIDGMFLLAQLYLSSLSGKLSPKAVRRELQKLTSGTQTYDDAYDNTMERIADQAADQKAMALNVISWITCAKRPLTTIELQHALAVELSESDLDEDNLPDVDDLVSICAGLVTITLDGSSNIIRFVHDTTREYFEQKLTYWLPDAQRDIAATCLKYVSFDTFRAGNCLSDNAFEERLEQYPLYSYAARNWGHHARNRSIPDSLLLTFLRDPLKTDACGQAIFARKDYIYHGDYCRRVPLRATGLHLVAYFGLTNVVESLLQSGDSIISTDSMNRTPLAWAAYSGHDETVKLFLDQGFDASERDVMGRNPMALAAKRGWEKVVRLLLDYGFEPEPRNPYGRPPISWAASRGHKEIVQLLLDRGAKPDAKDYDHRTPLLWAAAHGWLVITQILLDSGCDPNSQDQHGHTALSESAENGHLAVVELLLNKGAKTELEDAEGKKPLFWANHYGHVEVSMLLEERDTGRIPHELTTRKFHWREERLGAMPQNVGQNSLLEIEHSGPPERSQWFPPPDIPVTFTELLESQDSAHRDRKRLRGERFKCPFCRYTDRAWPNRGTFKRHIIDRHFPQFRYHCPLPSCRVTHHRRDKMRSHFRSHTMQGNNQEIEPVKECLPCPPNCPICNAETQSWDTFYRCVVNHSTVPRSGSSSGDTEDERWAMMSRGSQEPC